jgi:hypothetical protein
VKKNNAGHFVDPYNESFFPHIFVFLSKLHLINHDLYFFSEIFHIRSLVLVNIFEKKVCVYYVNLGTRVSFLAGKVAWA